MLNTIRLFRAEHSRANALKLNTPGQRHCWIQSGTYFAEKQPTIQTRTFLNMRGKRHCIIQSSNNVH